MIKELNLKVLILALFPLFCSCGTNENIPEPIIDASDKDVLYNIKKVQWPQAYATQDTVLLDNILGADFQMIDQGGAWYTKRDELNWISEHKTQNDSFFYEIKRFDILENGTALICGTGHIFNDSVRSQYQSSNVLVKRDGKWEAIMSHVSGVEVVD